MVTASTTSFLLISRKREKIHNEGFQFKRYGIFEEFEYFGINQFALVLCRFVITENQKFTVNFCINNHHSKIPKIPNLKIFSTFKMVNLYLLDPGRSASRTICVIPAL